MRRLRPCFKAILIAGLFAYGLLAVTLVTPLLSRWLGRYGESLCGLIRQSWSRAVCRVLGVRLQRSGKPSAAARLWAANHISWLDIIVLGGEAPLTFLAKSEVAGWPVLGYIARRIGTLFVRRGDSEQTAQIAEQMVWHLRKGRRLMVFPEGTSTDGRRVLRFHGKLLHPAQVAQSVIQPIALRYEGDARDVAPFIGDDEFVPHLWRVLQLEGMDVSLRYCEPLAPAAFRDRLGSEIRLRVVDALADVAHQAPEAGASMSGPPDYRRSRAC